MPDLIATAGGPGYTVKVEWWIEEDGAWTQVDDQPFVAGQKYNIYIESDAAYGYAFASYGDLTATINGMEATCSSSSVDYADYSI